MVVRLTICVEGANSTKPYWPIIFEAALLTRSHLCSELDAGRFQGRADGVHRSSIQCFAALKPGNRIRRDLGRIR